MNAESLRQLDEALSEPQAVRWTIYKKVMENAARRERDRWQICDKCEGTGCVCTSIPVTDREPDPEAPCCYDCGGSGVLPNQERLRAAIDAAEEAHDLRIPMIAAAVRAFDKETP